MRTLGPVAQTEGGPRISYPAPDSRIELASNEAVPLSARGGSGTLHWLIDGKPIDGGKWTPEGAGEARVAVVDDAGRSSAVTVHILRRP